MKKFIVVQNSNPDADKQYAVSDMLADKYGFTNIKHWDRTKAKSPLKLSMPDTASHASIKVEGSEDTFELDEELILNALDNYEVVLVAAILDTASNDGKSVLNNFSLYGVSGTDLVNLGTNASAVDTEEKTWYIAASFYKVAQSPLYYMLLNNKLISVTDRIQGHISSDEFEYLYVDAKCGTFKKEIFGQLISFSNVKKVLGDTLFLDTGTTEFSIDFKSKIWDLETDYFDFPLEVSTNFGYTVKGSVVRLQGTHNAGYVEVTIPNNVFEYSSTEDDLIFGYKILRSG